MIRTRDFLLFMATAGFLLVAITATVLVNTGSSPEPVLFSLNDEAPAEYGVEAPRDELDRSEQIARLRNKIESMEGQTIAAVPDTPEPTPTGTTSENDAEEATATGWTIALCDSYAPAEVGSWPATEIKTAEREGVRVVYTVSTELVPEQTGSSTEMVETEVENILLALPMRSRPLPNTSCIASDEVGVALDGSLIRNGDHALYGIFGPETLIGYALDGYPIYGRTTEIPTDECGGTMVGAGYRYYLHPDRDGILGCFAGAPVSI